MMLLTASYCTMACAQRMADMSTPTPLPPGSTLIIGFVGGNDRWNDEHRSVRRLVLKLRQRKNVYAESVSNHRRGVALQLIRRVLDTNHDGRLDPRERVAARIILFGQSWGGAAAISTACDLEKLGVPVLLTLQIDSVGMHNAVIPANVREAVNFYQHDRLTIRGREEIRAADPDQTKILGNFKSTYGSRQVDESNASWARRVFGRSHTKMELDPVVWNQVEDFILGAISRREP